MCVRPKQALQPQQPLLPHSVVPTWSNQSIAHQRSRQRPQISKGRLWPAAVQLLGTSSMLADSADCIMV